MSGRQVAVHFETKGANRVASEIEVQLQQVYRQPRHSLNPTRRGPVTDRAAPAIAPGLQERVH